MLAKCIWMLISQTKIFINGHENPARMIGHYDNDAKTGEAVSAA